MLERLRSHASRHGASPDTHLPEHVIKKHRYSGFFGADLDIILREWGLDGVDRVIISGTTAEVIAPA